MAQDEPKGLSVLPATVVIFLSDKVRLPLFSLSLSPLTVNSKRTELLPVSDPQSLALKRQCIFVKGMGSKFHLSKLATIGTCFPTKHCTGTSARVRQKLTQAQGDSVLDHTYPLSKHYCIGS